MPIIGACRCYLRSRQEINEKRRSVQDRLDELGEGVPLDTAERVQVMWTLVTDYCEMFKNTIRGWDELIVGRMWGGDMGEELCRG